MALTPFRVYDFNDAYREFNMDQARRLGRGGFGKVYLVKNKKTKIWWAAKYQNNSASSMKKMHRLEANYLADLQDDRYTYVPALYKYFEKAHHTLLICEYLRGGEIFEKINDRSFKLTEDKIIIYVKQLVKALHFIHSRHIVHLDMKPQNVMLADPQSDIIKIIDFGLAKRMTKMVDSRGREITGTKVGFAGTVGFMAPEVLKCTEATAATDFFSLGVVIFMLITGGCEPFWERDDNTAVKNTMKAKPFRHFENKKLPVSLDAKNFVEQLLEKKKEKRLYGRSCLNHPWLKIDLGHVGGHEVDKRGIRSYLARQRWKKLYKGVLFTLKVQKMMEGSYSGSGVDRVDSSRTRTRRVYDTMKTVNIPINIID